MDEHPAPHGAEGPTMAAAAGKPRLRAVPEQPDPWIAGGPLRPRVLFLDFDGVLHPLGPQASRFSRAAALSEALDALDPERELIGIALSTTWRFQPWETIASALASAAPGLAARLEGRSGSIGPAARHKEALAYMAARPGAPAEGFAALDDQPRLYGEIAPPWLAICDGSSGFSPSDARALAQALGLAPGPAAKPARP